jgi:hypothetical protein
VHAYKSTRILKLRLAESLLSAKTARLYAAGEHAAVRVKNGNVILSFLSENEDGEDSIESEGWLASLISVRAELAPGDLRALYLKWLLCAQSGELDPRDLSPPVPAGHPQTHVAHTRHEPCSAASPFLVTRRIENHM